LERTDIPPNKEWQRGSTLDCSDSISWSPRTVRAGHSEQGHDIALISTRSRDLGVALGSDLDRNLEHVSDLDLVGVLDLEHNGYILQNYLAICMQIIE
jgi:hypothetical protein